MDLTANLPNGLMDAAFDLMAATSMCWVAVPGIGRFPPPGDCTELYDRAYWESYCARADTDVGRALTRARGALVRQYFDGNARSMLDVGIGSGQFVKEYKCLGYDVNPHAVDWLSKNGAYADLYSRQFQAVCFWDSLEHIPQPAVAIKQCSNLVFVSIPIFNDLDDCLRSKHFKPGEHLWYFTDHGLKVWFDMQGFDCIEQNRMETDIGREGIGTYVFKRRQ